jgi:hypothetical protein
VRHDACRIAKDLVGYRTRFNEDILGFAMVYEKGVLVKGKGVAEAASA